MAFGREAFLAFAEKLQAGLEGFAGGLLEIGDDVVICAVGSGRRSGEAEVGGFEETVSRLVRVRKNLLERAPILGERVAVDGIIGRITEIVEGGLDEVWTFRVGDER